jgi:hypothetical protein
LLVYRLAERRSLSHISAFVMVSKDHCIIELAVVLITYCLYWHLLADPCIIISCNILSVWILESLIAILAKTAPGDLLRLT